MYAVIPLLIFTAHLFLNHTVRTAFLHAYVPCVVFELLSMCSWLFYSYFKVHLKPEQ